MVTGKDLRLLRQEHGVSLHQFAKKAGLSVGHLSRVEREVDGRSPSPNIIRCYEHVLGVSVVATVAGGLAEVASHNLESVDRRSLLTVTATALAGSVSFSAAASDARTAAHFARNIAEGTIDNLTVEQIEADCQQLARRYVSEPLDAIFVEIRSLRDDVFELVGRNRHPKQMRSLYLAASRLCGLQAHICLDLGFYPEADTHARAALQAARVAGHPGAYAWVRSLQSLIAYWDGRPSDAIRYAEDGAPRAQDRSTAVRLPALKARAAALIGDRQATVVALDAADQARTANLADDETGGVFSFPEAKQAAYAGTALLGVVDADLGHKAVEQSSRALALYEAASPLDRSTGDILAANLDLASAYIVRDDLDAAAHHIAVVIEAPPNRRTASVRKRARVLAADLAVPRYASTQLGPSLQERLLAFGKPHHAINAGGGSEAYG